MELILIRHGTTEGNKERRFIGRLDVPLAPEGEELARSTAAQLPPVEHLYVSPMRRTRRTAELLWPGVEQTLVDDLRETDFGPFEGKNHEELKENPLYQKWLAGEVSVGEPAEECAHRATRALQWLTADAAAHGYERIGVVSHGGLLMGMLAVHGRPARKSFYDWYPANCAGYRTELTMEPLTLTVLGPAGRAKA